MRLLYTDLGHLAWCNIVRNLVGNFGKRESPSVVSMYCSSYKTQTVLFYFIFSNGRHQQEIGRCKGRNVGSLSSLAPFLSQLLWEKKEFPYCLNVLVILWNSIFISDIANLSLESEIIILTIDLCHFHFEFILNLKCAINNSYVRLPTTKQT